MGILEIVSAICLILSCVFIIIMVLMQDSKKGMSQAITGGSSDNFYQKNSGRSKEAKLARMTRTAAILFFVVTLVVNVFAVYFKDGDSGNNNVPDNVDIAGDFDLDDFDWESLFDIPEEDEALPEDISGENNDTTPDNNDIDPDNDDVNSDDVE